MDCGTECRMMTRYIKKKNNIFKNIFIIKFIQLFSCSIRTSHSEGNLTKRKNIRHTHRISTARKEKAGSLIDPCHTVLCQYHGKGLTGWVTYCSICTSTMREPKAGQEYVQFIVKTIHFSWAYRTIICVFKINYKQ